MPRHVQRGHEPRWSAARCSTGWLSHLREVRFRALLDLVLTQVFRARRDPPLVAGGIGQKTRAITPELILDRLRHLRTRVDRALEERVAVVGVDPEARGRSATALRALSPPPSSR